MKRFLVLLCIFMIIFPKVVLGEENYLSNGKSGLLIEVSSGKILYEKNKDDRLSVASMTKMVALIIIMEK